MTPTLENWIIYGKVASGDIYNHPQYLQGEEITTSIVKNLDIAKNVLTTKNSVYILGVMDETFKNMILQDYGDVEKWQQKFNEGEKDNG